MAADLRDLEREIEIGRKLRGTLRAALLTAFAALASFTALLPGAMLTVFAAATFLRGGNVGRGKSARQRGMGGASQQ